MKTWIGLGLLVLVCGAAHAYDNPDDIAVSTTPIGSPFYRNLAFDLNVDLRELVKFEKKGFGHAEMVSLILISKSSGTVLKEYGKRRLKMDVSLEQLANEVGLDYPTLYKVSRIIKESIEAKGVLNLPPPVLPLSKEEEKKAKEEKEKEGKTPAPTPSPSPTP